VYDTLVFLDSDDNITTDFVKNRSIKISDFTVFKNMIIVDQDGTQVASKAPNTDYLNHFLNAHFIWQTTSVVWQKAFLQHIGAFNTKLQRLQDVELSIRALYRSKHYKVVNNSVDFYYSVSPIRAKDNFVQPVCESVNYLISHALSAYTLSQQQRNLVKAYYFMCTKYLERSENRSHITYVAPNLSLFYKEGYFGLLDYIIGSCLLKLYKFRLVSGSSFLRLNRYFFKTQVASND
jgi:hypothetical protein